MKLIPSVLLVCLFVAPAVFAEDGAALFKGKCAMCHAADGSGNTPMGKKLGLKALSAPEVQKATDEEMHETIVKGKGKMPPFEKKLTADQVKVLIRHVRSLAEK